MHGEVKGVLQRGQVGVGLGEAPQHRAVVSGLRHEGEAAGGDVAVRWGLGRRKTEGESGKNWMD